MSIRRSAVRREINSSRGCAMNTSTRSTWLRHPSSNDAVDASCEAFVVALLGGAGVVAAVVTAAAVLALHLGRRWRRPVAVAVG
jgi:hypothetical protein